eukprot:jgi/Tetstr1/455919/TSEL_042700.t1
MTSSSNQHHIIWLARTSLKITAVSTETWGLLAAWPGVGLSDDNKHGQLLNERVQDEASGLAAAARGAVFLANGAARVRAECNKAGRTAFHWAVRGDQLAACRLLLAAGSDPWACMPDSSRALHWAMFFGALTAADWMVDELGCALDAHNETACTPLHACAAVADGAGRGL